MHATLLILAMVAGAEARIGDTYYDPAASSAPEAVYAEPFVSSGGTALGGGEAFCPRCGHGGRGGGLLGHMPQSCYGPRYGCYPGATNRHLHRYPAYHGTFYRRPYHPGDLFEYPWHAALHEPTSLFSYHVPAEGEALDPLGSGGSVLGGAARGFSPLRSGAVPPTSLRR